MAAKKKLSPIPHLKILFKKKKDLLSSHLNGRTYILRQEIIYETDNGIINGSCKVK